MSENNRKINGLKITVAGIIAFVCIIAILINYILLQKSTTDEQLETTIQNSTLNVSEMTDFSASYALSSIQVTATAVSADMTSEEIENPHEVIDKYKKDTPFSSIEYLNADGMNFTDAGNPFDASDREYYIEGIKGNTGIWINYTPKYSKEPLINFYAPLYFDGHVAGVITGTIGSESNLKPLLMSEFYEQKVIGIIVDENNRIITSSENGGEGLILSKETAEVKDTDKKLFMSSVNNADGDIFRLKGENGYAVGSVSKVNSTGWKVIQIVPAASLNNINESFSNAMILSIVGIIIVSAGLFIIIFLEVRRVSKASIDKANSERDQQLAILSSMADIYYSMHLINLKENNVYEYSSRNEVKEIVNTSSDAVGMMKDVIHATITDEHLEQALSFTDLGKLPQAIKDQKIISSDFIGKHTGWIRLAFIVIEKDENGIPTTVVCTTQVINEQKKKELTLLTQSNTDKLTGFFNRRAYEEDIQNYQGVPSEENFIFIAMDINGLKVVNDNLGHKAGDELIKGASKCMLQCFGNYGKVYRTGGDEFSAVIFADESRLEEIKQDFEETTLKWSGSLVDSLAVSCGYVSKREFPEMTTAEMIKLADERMYKAKAEYYKHKGVDRKGQMAAHAALHALYTKILRINLTTDTYQIVNMDKSEMSADKGFTDSISGWLEGFGKSGLVHRDDVEVYLRETNIENLRHVFRTERKSFGIVYRRMIDDRYQNVLMEMIVSENYTDDNQELYLYVKSIDR